MEIDEEFRDLIDPLSDEEFDQLQRNVVRDGCLDPIKTWNGLIVDGHNRYRICTEHGIDFKTEEVCFKDRDEATIWIVNNQLGRRNISLFTRTALALKKEEIFKRQAKERQLATLKQNAGPTVTQKSGERLDKHSKETAAQVGKVANTSRDTVAKVKKIQEAARLGLIDDDTLRAVRNQEKSINRVARDIDEKKKQKAREQQRQKAVQETPPQFFDNVHIGDFRDHFDKVADNSLSLIFTDPPYDRKSTGLYADLGRFASQKLVDGGSLVTYIGHIQIEGAIAGLSDHLRLWWVLCCLHSGQESLMREYGIRVGWKPMLWFVKGSRADKSNIVKDVVTGSTEKSHHDWQQSETEAAYWINELCPVDGIVCDPFLGGGTTAAAAIKCGRRWIAMEKDHDQAVLAMTRVKGDLR